MDAKGKETCIFDTYKKHFYFIFQFQRFFSFQHRKRNNCFTRSFHAFSFESEFAGGRAFARGPLFSKKKKEKKEEKKKKKRRRRKRGKREEHLSGNTVDYSTSNTGIAFRLLDQKERVI